MKRINLGANDNWKTLCTRPASDLEQTKSKVEKILADVKVRGDKALKEYTALYDRAQIADFAVSSAEIKFAQQLVPDELKQALQSAKKNIGDFHLSELATANSGPNFATGDCWRELRPIERVGLYAPGGVFPLFSSVLMLAEPARLAGCRDRYLCSPPRADGSINPIILYSAQLCGISKIFKLGGAQALAALCYGTESIPAVDKVYGPGNRYVTAAKLVLLSQGFACDLPAGPSELLIIADRSAKPNFLAAELLAQAEHGADSQVVVISESSELLDEIETCLKYQASKLGIERLLSAAGNSCLFIAVDDLEQAFAFSNRYAPEHLMLAISQPDKWLPLVQNAGGVFLGAYSSIVAGDYAAGPNHTLPTAGFARAYSGLSLNSFMKSISFQRLSKAGLNSLAPSIIAMAKAEGMIAHAAAIELRMQEDL